MKPGISYGYAGPICYCFAPLKIQRPSAEAPSMPTLVDDKGRLEEMLGLPMQATGSAGEFEAAAKAESERFGNSIACTPRYAHLVGARWGYERGKSIAKEAADENSPLGWQIKCQRLEAELAEAKKTIEFQSEARIHIQREWNSEIEKVKSEWQRDCTHIHRADEEIIDRLTKENAELREDLKENQKAVNERGMSIQILRQERDELRAKLEAFERDHDRIYTECLAEIREATARAEKAESEVERLGGEVEDLMHVDYWQDRHNIVVKERDRLKRALEKIREQRNVYHTICEENDLTRKPFVELDAEIARILDPGQGER